jgi:hypothetical protein
MGDGSMLDVVPTDLGRVGGLICWGNYMPLARFHLYAQALLSPSRLFDFRGVPLASYRRVRGTGERAGGWPRAERLSPSRLTGFRGVPLASYRRVRGRGDGGWREPSPGSCDLGPEGIEHALPAPERRRHG